MELENQGLQAQLTDTATQLHNASSAHEEAAAQAARLQGSLEEAQKSGAAVSAELSACTSKVWSCACVVVKTPDKPLGPQVSPPSGTQAADAHAISLPRCPDKLFLKGAKQVFAHWAIYNTSSGYRTIAAAVVHLLTKGGACEWEPKGKCVHVQIEDMEAQMADMQQSRTVLAETESSLRQQVSGLQVCTITLHACCLTND